MNKEIYHTLRDRIIYLDYDPGLILKEQELAKEFGVSRTPLRTVLFRLEWEHLIKILPRTGILVVELELHTITHVFQARLELEAVIGTLAAQRFSTADEDRMEILISRCDSLMDHKAPRELANLDMEIKQLYNLAAGNPFLTEMSERLYSLTLRLWYFNLLKMGNQDWKMEVSSVKEDLAELLHLMQGKNPAATGKARKTQLLKHLKRIRSNFLGLAP